MKIQAMIDELCTMGKRKNDPLMIETILYYFGSIMLNKYKLRKGLPGMKPYVRYYTVFFGNSGLGKSFNTKQIEKLCGLNTYSELMHNSFISKLQKMPDRPDGIETTMRYIPKSVTIGLEGSKEGLFSVVEAQAFSDFGSLNLISEEFGEAVSSSSEMMSKLKQLYDTEYQAKVVKGNSETGGMNHDVNNIICNFMGLGSREGFDVEAEKELYRIVTSGLYRRSIIIESNLYVEKNEFETDFVKTALWIEDINKIFREDAIARVDSSTNYMMDREFDYENDYIDYIEQIDDALVDDAVDDRLNKFKQYSTGSLELIIDISHIIAFYEGKLVVTSDHLAQAYNFFTRTRETVIDTFSPKLPYKLMYELLKKKNNLTVSEMCELEPNIPSAATKIKDNLSLLDELCYRRDEVLVRHEGKVLRFSIEPLPETDLNKLRISVSNDGKMEKAVNFVPYEINWSDLKKVCISENIDSFCLCHFDDSAQAPDGHRKRDKFIEGQNVIAFDIDDDKLSIKDAQALLHEYTYFIYTTKSHQKEKTGAAACDRYRIVIPTKNQFYVSPEAHKQLYINLEEFLCIHNNDTQTRNVSRLWFTNSNNSQTFENSGELFDVTPFIPDTDKSDKFKQTFNQATSNVDFDTMDIREAGMLKWFIANTSNGNRHHNLTKLYYFYRDLGSNNIDQKVANANALLSEPMNDRDMKNIYSIGRKS
jgi:hypothetical protein